MCLGNHISEFNCDTRSVGIDLDPWTTTDYVKCKQLFDVAANVQANTDRLPVLPRSLSSCLPRFKPLLVQCLSRDVISDTDVAGAFLDALGGYGEPHVISGISEYLVGLISLGFSIDEVVQEVISNLDRVRIWTRSLLWVYHLSGIDTIDLTAPICRFMAKYLQLSLLNMGEKVLKYHTNYLFCRWSEQHDIEDYIKRECPPCEEGSVPGYMFGGKYDQHLRRVLLSNKDRYTSKRAMLAYTLIQCKRMWMPISVKLQKDALIKHRETLSAEKKSIFELAPIPGSFLHTLSREVRRTVIEIFSSPHSSVPYSGADLSSPDVYVPSLSSHVTPEGDKFNRKKGGAFGYFSEGRGGLDCNDLILYRTWTPRNCDLAQLELRGFIREHEISTYVKEKSFRADVHIVLEPAKARIITAGPPVAYHHLKPVQRRIWSLLKCHPTFQLIGGVKMSEAVNQLKIGREWESDDYLVSADYSAATDNLHPYLINACAEQIGLFFNMDSALFSSYRKSLLKHTITYPEMDKGCGPFLPPCEQKWGQLMGSPSSFPILCIINAAVCRFAMERSEGRKFFLDELPLLINGDDAGFRLKMKDYADWKRIVVAAGLEPSLGKNYVSREFIMLNSELHLMKSRISHTTTARPEIITNDRMLSLLPEGEWFPKVRKVERYFKYVPFVNFGLLAGQSKVMADSRKDNKFGVERVGGNCDQYDIPSVANELVRGHSKEMIEKIVSWFLVQSKDKIKAATFKKNPQSWFLPRQLGGLGIPTSKERYLTRGQAKLAAYLAVCPTMDYSLPKSLLSNPKKAQYVKLAALEEMKVTDQYQTYWIQPKVDSEGRDATEYDPNHVEVDVNYKRHFTAVSHHLQSERDYVREQVDTWNKLWKKGTNTKIEPLTFSQAMEYRDRKIAHKRPDLTSTGSVDPTYHKEDASTETVLCDMRDYHLG